MYNDEWEPVATAGLIEGGVEEFAALAKKKAETEQKPLGDIVYSLTHEIYMMKHTTGDVLEEVYKRAANDHLMQYLKDEKDLEFWYDYTALSLAAGLEWAVINELEKQLAH
jgi:hypothetical protein